MSSQITSSRSGPSPRPRVPLDRMQAAVLAAMRRQAVLDQRVLKALVQDPKGRSAT